MSEQAELEFTLHCVDGNRYEARLRYSPPHSDADIELTPGQAVAVQFDMDRLRAEANDPDAYGKALSADLFSHPDLRTAFGLAQSNAAGAGVDLRLRLRIDPSTCGLHSLRWETLHDPLNPERRLTTDSAFWFSRYVISSDLRAVTLRPQQELRVLAAVANPTDLSRYRLEPIRVEEQMRSLESALAGAIPYKALTETGSVTLEKLFAELQQGYDILYVVAHGTLKDDQPYLFLENDAGQAVPADGDTIVQRMRELQDRPRLVVLAACVSAGTDRPDLTEGALAALGPRLAEEGIPAVLAMHGTVSQDTARDFLEVFFRELGRGGQIDRAMALARSQVQGRPDWWAPVLYMRLKSGQIQWYNLGFTDEEGKKKWKALVASIRDRECVPVTGLGLAESFFGSRRQMALAWAREHAFPMSPHEREGLPQVSQYLSVHQNAKYTRRSLVSYLCGEVRRRQWDLVSEEYRHLNLEELSREDLLRLLNRLLSEVWARLPPEVINPYRLLAELNLPIYLTADPTDLLLNALKEKEGCIPVVQLCPWNAYTENQARQTPLDPGYIPNPQQPLVYYLFGRLEEPESLVLTEDDYFNYLIHTAQNSLLMPTDLRTALIENMLMFLGFGFDDWDFRALLRMLMNLPGRTQGFETTHIATQIAPQPGDILSPEDAKTYLEEYYRGASIQVFWGTHRDFTRELQRRWRGGT